MEKEWEEKKRWRAIRGAREEGEKKEGRSCFPKCKRAINYPLAIPIQQPFPHLFGYKVLVTTKISQKPGPASRQMYYISSVLINSS